VKLGVEYVMTKPCDLRATVERIHDLSFRIRQPLISVPDPRNQVSAILSTLGIPAKYKGYGYLREAILCIARQPDQGITKELYPTIAAMFGSQVTGQNVERSIRNAIEQAWLRRDDRIWKMYFTPDRNGEIPKPSNSDFIHTLADTLQLSQAAITG
jgi:two-component system response regulator (stage 0 sporulation protein A)